MRRFLSILSLLCVVVLSSLHADTASQAQAATESLRSDHPIDAASRYRTVLNDSSFRTAGSPELWYNLGLAEEKSANTAVASLCYRRALLLDPTFTPAQRQLETVLVTLGLPVPSGWHESVRQALHPEVLVVAGSILGWIGVFGLILLIFLAPRRKFAIGAVIVLLILGHGAAVLGTLVDPRRVAADKAVVTAKKSPVLHATPADSGAPGGTLTPGLLVSVLSRNGAWWYVSGGPGLTGWIPSDTVTPLLPAVSSSAGGSAGTAGSAGGS
jgi:hypothetical protein